MQAREGQPPRGREGAHTPKLLLIGDLRCDLREPFIDRRPSFLPPQEADAGTGGASPGGQGGGAHSSDRLGAEVSTIT